MAVDREALDSALKAIRQNIQADGGDLKFLSVDDDGTVHLELHGACVGCPLSAMEFGVGIERILKEHVPGVTHVDVQDADMPAGAQGGFGYGYPTGAAPMQYGMPRDEF